MRIAARVDDNQAEIVKALRSIGCTVQSLAAIGKGCPDLLVGFNGVNLTLEVKDGAKIPSKRKLTTDEQKWHMAWNGQVAVIESVDDAIAIIQSIRLAE